MWRHDGRTASEALQPDNVWPKAEVLINDTRPIRMLIYCRDDVACVYSPAFLPTPSLVYPVHDHLPCIFFSMLTLWPHTVPINPYTLHALRAMSGVYDLLSQKPHGGLLLDKEMQTIMYIVCTIAFGGTAHPGHH